jgi:hypothetical protein
MGQLLGAWPHAQSGEAEADQDNDNHGDHKVKAEERDAADTDDARCAGDPWPRGSPQS